MAQAYIIKGTNEYKDKKGLIYSPDAKNALKGFLLQEKIKYSKIKKITNPTEESNFKVQKEFDFSKNGTSFFKVQ